MNFLYYSLGIFIHPNRTLQRFLIDGNRMRYSLAAVLLFAFLYSVLSLSDYLLGIAPTYGWEPFIKIPIQEFYLWQSIYLIPITMIGWIFFAGCVQLLGKPFGGRGNFEDTFIMVGLPFIILIPAMMLPDWIVWTVLPDQVGYSPFFNNLINPVRLLAASLWVMLVHGLAIQKAQQLSFRNSILITLMAYIPYMLLNFIFIH